MKKGFCIIILLCFGFFGTSKAQDCLDLSLMLTGGLEAQYQDDLSYPIGAEILSEGDLKLIKTNSSSDPSDPTKISSADASSIMFQGPLTFDCSAGENAKKLELSITFGNKITIDQTVFSMTGMSTNDFPYEINDSVLVYFDDNGNTVFQGKFDKITYSNGFNGSIVHSMCLESYDDENLCIPNFTYSSNNTTITFENSSSADIVAASFKWKFGNGDSSTVENPVKTYEAGTYNVCFDVSDPACFLTPEMEVCETITIKDENACLDGNYSITPNNDGDKDYITLAPKSKVYDRNMQLVLEVADFVDWTGIDSYGGLLSTGNYTVVCTNGGTYNVTVIR